ncbi:hypothetical protein [Saccharothrix sp.]|uniref:hypothetical protein n=1 Tax=Saccharothrix sp. TaxID=1873460 RepID=UPI00281151F9|nr:hypothetical protein [Saccharothrix sp.]
MDVGGAVRVVGGVGARESLCRVAGREVWVVGGARLVRGVPGTCRALVEQGAAGLPLSKVDDERARGSAG